MNHPDTHALTASQLHLWKSQALSPDKPLFNQVITVEIDLTNRGKHHNEELDAQLQNAWDRVLASHAVLNYVIHTHPDGTPFQGAGETKSPLQFVTLDYQLESDKPPSISSTTSTNEALRSWIADRSTRSFDLNITLLDAVVIRVNQHRSVFYLNMHHIIADAWSTMLVWQAISHEFSHPGSLSPPQRAFSDYLLETENSTSPTSILNINPITGQKSPAPQTDSNPNTRPMAKSAAVPETANQAKSRRPVFYGIDDQLPSTESSRLQVPLTDADWQALAQLGKDPQLQQLNKNLFAFTLHMTVLAICLHRASQDEVIIIEAPLLGRFDTQWMKTTGNFIEMARFEIALQPAESITDIYLKCRNAVYNNLKTACTGMTRLLKAGPVHGVLNYITAQNSAAQNDQLNSNIQWHHTGHSDTHHPVRLHVTDWNDTGQPDLQLDVNSAFFPENKSSTVLQHLLATYQGLLTSRESALAEIPLIQQHEQWSFDGVMTPAPDGSTVVQLLERQLEANTESVALDDGTGTMRYGDLLSLAIKVSSSLLTRGIGPGDRVAVCLPRCIELPSILLGILRSGAAFIPIDINQPILRVMDILLDAQVSCSIIEPAQAALLTQTPSFNSPVISVQELLNSTPINTPSFHSKPINPLDPAYLIYTSGSTGKPKGVIVSHGALVNYLSWAVEYYRLEKPLVMPLFTSIGFDLTITTLFLPLLTAGTIRVFPQTTGSDNAVIFDVLKDSSITTVKLTPAHLSLLAEQDMTASNILQLIVGGEDLKSDLANRASRQFTQGLKIINEYGPTEATVGCVIRKWRATDPVNGSVPIGLPIRNTSAYVLNEARLPQLEGVAGDLYISGPSLASGYWNDNELSHASYTDNPWRPTEKLYRTGDLARVINGELVYLGRKDNQLKISGYRIDISEIESALLAHPAVTECIALANNIIELSAQPDKQRFCTKCGLSSHHPDANLDENNLCQICISYAPIKSRINNYFKSLDDLQSLIEIIKTNNSDNASSEFDAIVLLSGGKDSTYSLCKLVDMGLNVCALSLDNGFLSDQAKANINVVCDALQVEHHYVSTPAMDEIFVDSLNRYSNVCHGCFKTIYTLALKFAADRSISYIFTGLSRGQLFETRLSNELFTETDTSEKRIDTMVRAARMQYHAIADAPNTLLDIREVNEGSLVEKIEIIDFYRYCHIELSEMLSYIKSRAGWLRPPDTGRSTNCLINDVGIHVHKLERGYHNYSLPYSWDVRLGHKQRTEALEELDDDINSQNVTAILSRIGYTPKATQHKQTWMSIHFTASESLNKHELVSWMNARLPEYMLPQRYAQLEEIPLNANGKIDRAKLQLPSDSVPDLIPGREPRTTEERLLADLWKDYVQADKVGAEDNFFELGGDSLSAIRCVMQLRRMGYAVEPAELFQHPRLAQFATLLQNSSKSISDQTVSTAPIKFASLKKSQKDKLEKLLKKKTPDNLP